MGVIHSPLSPEKIAWPGEVCAEMAKLSPSPELLCQSPYHWAGGYLLAAVLLVVLGTFKTGGNEDDTLESRSDAVA